MNCYHCQTELIWGGDHDNDRDDDHLIETNLSCPKCNAFVIVWWGDKEESDDQPRNVGSVANIATGSNFGNDYNDLQSC